MAEAVNIGEALDAFLADQRQRLSERTMRNYEYVVELLCDSLNGYGPNTLDKADEKRWRKAYDAGDEEAFCHLFGPERIIDHFGEFLGYFMVRKVWASQELLRSAGTVTKKLAGWLHEHGYVSADEREDAVEQGNRAARNLPRAERLANLLYDQSRSTPPFDAEALDPKDLVETYLVIQRVEPGALYFSGGIGPLEVPKRASELAQVGWGVNATLARLGKTWRLVEVGNVYPH
ncbi:MAG: hypothetical protein M0Z42_21540 [Actinomycetota bacterium]|nr:hypothetical protein [Actinomycetota bacterium]